MRDLNITLIDVTQMLVVVEGEILKNTCKEKMLIGYDSKVSMDICNGDIVVEKSFLFPMERGHPRSNCLIIC